MAYLYVGSATTQFGKVIYPRKRHAFNAKDLARIGKAVGFPSEDRYRFAWFMALLDMLELLGEVGDNSMLDIGITLQDVIKNHVGSIPAFVEFGGGAFGGAGATGRIHWPWQGNPFDTDLPT